MLIVILSPSERKAAASLGLKREQLRRSRGKAQDYDQRGDRGGTMDERNAIGAIAEYALAKHLGPDVLRLWCETQAFSLDHKTIQADVGRNLQVRASDNKNATLWMYDHDKHPDAPYILARVLGNTVEFVGWVYGKDGQLPEFWDRLGWSRFGPDRAAFNIPSQLLRPMEELPSEHVRRSDPDRGPVVA